MPIIRDIHLRLTTAEVLRQAGTKEHHGLNPETKTAIKELLSDVKKERLLEPVIAQESYQITEIGDEHLSLAGKTILHGRLLPSDRAGAVQLVVAVGTIGPKLEARVKRLFESNDPLRGLLLDSIGSAAVESLTDEASRRITCEALRQGYQASSPLSPGDPGFAISEQWQLLSLVPAEAIGIRLTASGLMVPRKSVSTVIGVGLQMKTWTRAQACARCSLSKTCRYRLNTPATENAEPQQMSDANLHH